MEYSMSAYDYEYTQYVYVYSTSIMHSTYIYTVFCIHVRVFRKKSLCHCKCFCSADDSVQTYFTPSGEIRTYVFQYLYS